MTPIDWLGGRKSVLGYAFLGCSTFLIWVESHSIPANYIGMATVIGAMATGVAALVWGNVKEHEVAKPLDNQPAAQ